MKQKLTLFFYGFFILLVVLFIYGSFTAPFSVDHGYLVALAKLRVEGLMPYRDFILPETPLGIELLALPYRILGVDASGNWAVGFICTIHLLNCGLLAKLMKRVYLEPYAIWGSLCFYLLVIFSSDALMVNTEPFAVCLMLIAVLFIFKRNHRKLFIGWGALFFVLAVACKIQVVVMLPLMLALILWHGKTNRIHWEKALLFLGVVLAGCGLCYMAITVRTGMPGWIDNMAWVQEEKQVYFYGLMLTQVTSVKEVLVNLVILAGRCSLYFYILLPFVWKKLPIYGKRFACFGLVATGSVAGLFFLRAEFAYGFFMYPFIIIAFAFMLDAASARRWMWIIALTVFLLPGYLFGRELIKLDWGRKKAEQTEEIRVLRSYVKQPIEAVIIPGDCNEYDLGPQFYSEIPLLRPVNLSTSKFGRERTADDLNALAATMTEVDYILLTEKAIDNLLMSGQEDAFFDATADKRAVGIGHYMLYIKKEE